MNSTGTEKIENAIPLEQFRSSINAKLYSEYQHDGLLILTTHNMKFQELFFAILDKSNMNIPLNIKPVDVVRGLKRQQFAASTNFVGRFLLDLSYFFFLFFSQR